MQLPKALGVLALTLPGTSAFWGRPGTASQDTKPFANATIIEQGLQKTVNDTASHLYTLNPNGTATLNATDAADVYKDVGSNIFYNNDNLNSTRADTFAEDIADPNKGPISNIFANPFGALESGNLSDLVPAVSKQFAGAVNHGMGGGTNTTEAENCYQDFLYSALQNPTAIEGGWNGQLGNASECIAQQRNSTQDSTSQSSSSQAAPSTSSAGPSSTIAASRQSSAAKRQACIGRC